MSDQTSALAVIRVQLERQMVAIKAARPIKHEHPKRVLSDHPVKLFRSRLFEVLR
jgi:hypothetical protein